MISVGTLEAKTRFSELLGRVAKGEKILIMRRGKPVAMLIPPEVREAPVAMLISPEVRDRQKVASLVKEMLRTRDESGPTLGKDLTMRQLIEEGR